jgi:hypothetical protein
MFYRLLGTDQAAGKVRVYAVVGLAQEHGH